MKEKVLNIYHIYIHMSFRKKKSIYGPGVWIGMDTQGPTGFFFKKKCPLSRKFFFILEMDYEGGGWIHKNHHKLMIINFILYEHINHIESTGPL